MGASILTAVGRPEWVAADDDAYVQCATQLASDIDRLAELRRGLRNEMLASPLCDEAGFTAALENGYRAMLAQA